MITTMAKTLIAFYSRRGQNYVDGSIRNLKAALPSATIKKGLSIQGSKVKTAGKQIEEFVKGR